MPTVRIGAITAGLVISCDVKDLNGRLLLRQGVSMEDRHIQLLKSWGITEVEVVALPDAVPPNANMTEEEKAKWVAKSAASATLREIFSRNDLSHPMIHELLELCIARKAKLPW